MPYPAFPKFTRQSLSGAAKRPKCCACGETADYRVECEPAAFAPGISDWCSIHARQFGYVGEIPGRLVTSFDGLPMTMAQHDAHVRAYLDDWALTGIEHAADCERAAA